MNCLIRPHSLVNFLFYWCFLCIIFNPNIVYAFTSKIVETDGYACMGEDKTRRQTEQQAIIDAKRAALEQVITNVKSSTKVVNYQMVKDIIDAYSQGTVSVLKEISKKWYKDPSMGDCFRVRIQSEVKPDNNIKNISNKSDDSTKTPEIRRSPLFQSIWLGVRFYQDNLPVEIENLDQEMFKGLTKVTLKRKPFSIWIPEGQKYICISARLINETHTRDENLNPGLLTRSFDEAGENKVWWDFIAGKGYAVTPYWNGKLYVGPNREAGFNVLFNEPGPNYNGGQKGKQGKEVFDVYNVIGLWRPDNDQDIMQNEDISKLYLFVYLDKNENYILDWAEFERFEISFNN